MRDWRRTQFGQSLPRTRYGGVVPEQLLSVGEGDGDGDERSAATGQAVGYGAGGNCVANLGVRPVVDVRAEHVEAAAALLVVSSLAAGVGKRPGRFQRSDRSGK